jgi:ParB-like chromosome segregation protein Spo0J
MRRSLEQHGQLTAVVAFDDGRGLQLVDGFKRLRGAQQLGWKGLQAQILALDPATATAVIGTLHEHHQLNELEEAWVIRSLCRQHGLSQGAVARLVRRHKSWVSRRLALIERLEEAVQADVRLGLLSPRSAIALAVLPRGNQRQAAELVMQRGMTTRQVDALVQQLGQLDSDQARQALIKQWPEASPATTQGPRPRSDVEHLLADVATLMRVGVRLEVRLLDMALPTQDSDVARQALVQLAALLDPLGRAIARSLKQQDRIDATLAIP